MLRGRIIDDLIGKRRGCGLAAISALHGANDIAALAHAAQRIGKVRREAPVRRANLRGETKPLQCLQPTHADRLIEGATSVRARQHIDRKSVVEGKGWSVRVDLGGRRSLTKKK